MTTTDSRVGHSGTGTHSSSADPGSDFRASQTSTDTHAKSAGADQADRPDHPPSATHRRCVEPVATSLRAIGPAMSSEQTPAGTILPADHQTIDTHVLPVGGTNSSPPAILPPTSSDHSLEGNQTRNESAATIESSIPTQRASLADPFLALAADVLDDAERTRIANENRLRQLTRTATDVDGEERGFGLDLTHPDVARLAALVDMLAKIEHQATLNLNRLLRQHPLGAWCKAQKGVGDKQAARLLAVIGDPYVNTLYDRPRTVSELWAYCGLHVFPVGHTAGDAHSYTAVGDQSAAGGDSSHSRHDTQRSSAGVAARRSKGQKANWSTTAKTRAYLIAESMLKAGNREAYDKRKAATEGRTHAAPCAPCGPKGKPAEAGSPWSLKHRHVDAMRIQSKELLKELWREARRLHES